MVFFDSGDLGDGGCEDSKGLDGKILIKASRIMRRWRVVSKRTLRNWLSEHSREDDEFIRPGSALAVCLWSRLLQVMVIVADRSAGLVLLYNNNAFVLAH